MNSRQHGRGNPPSRGPGQTQASESRAEIPNRLPIPDATATLYSYFLGTSSAAHPAYALSKMVAWYEGWQRERKKAPSVKDHAFKSAVRALTSPELRQLAEIVRARRETWLAPLERAGMAQRLVLTALTDAVVWLVSPGPLELGLALHYGYGFPFLPGSSLKGLARPVARGADKGVADERYGSQGFVGPVAILDGLPCSDWKVQRDVMTPHFGDWYQGKRDLPDDKENPVPIPFLTIAAGSRFEVAFLARDGGAAAMLDAVTQDLQQGLGEQGLGAKTAAGYGVFRVEVLPCKRVESVDAPALSSEPVSDKSARVAQPRESPPPPARDPHIVEAERLIRSLKHHEVKSSLQTLAEATGKCPAGKREGLFALFRARQEELGVKAKHIRVNMESLAQRLGPAKDREP